MPTAEKQQKYSPIYIGILTLSFLVITSIITTYALRSIKLESRSYIRDSLQAVLQTTVTTYHTWLNHHINYTTELATDPFLLQQTQQLLIQKNDPSTLLKLRELLQPKLEREKDLGFFIIDRERLSIASMRDINLYTTNLIHQQRPEYLNRAFNGESLFVPPLFSDVSLTAEQSPDNINIATNNDLSAFTLSPILINNKIEAVLAIRLNLNTFFTQAMDFSQLGSTGETYAFDRNGIMITNSRFDQQLRRTGLVAANDKSIMNVRITDPGGNLLKGYKPKLSRNLQPLTVMAQAATQGESGYHLEGYRDYRGVTVMGAWHWDETMGFGIASEIDMSEAMLPFNQTRKTMASVLTLTIVLALLLLALVIKIQQASKRSLKKAYNTLEQRVQSRTRELNNAKEALEQANHDLEILATIDGLTGLANRRTLDSHLESEWLRCRREKKSLGIIMLDIDYFKKYNDHYGHQQGDMCLKTIADALKTIHSIRRPGDLIARYGGEEFIIILSDPTHQYIEQTCQRLVEKVRQLGLQHEKSDLDKKIITISAGCVIEGDLSITTPSQLLHKADLALYTAKHSGRNQFTESKEAHQLPAATAKIIKGSFNEK